MIIGEKIRRLRMELQLTQEELADRTELTKGYISQVERDLASPSIATLVDILEALGTNLQEFFSKKPAEQIVFKKDDFFENIQDEYKISYIIPNAQKNEMEPILLTIHGHERSKEMECHNGEEFGYILKGNVTLVRGNKKYRLKAKETVDMDGKESHYFISNGSSDGKILWVTTPPMF